MANQTNAAFSNLLPRDIAGTKNLALFNKIAQRTANLLLALLWAEETHYA